MFLALNLLVKITETTGRAMLHKANSLRGYTLHSLTGEVGKVAEFFFDDKHWTIRYLVADTGGWITDRQVLLSPYALTSVNREGRFISVDLTLKQIEESPSLASDKPVSRQYEEDYYGYYGWPMYLSGPYRWGAHPTLERDKKKWVPSFRGQKAWDAHLRSTRDVEGHHVQAVDGEIGHVEDFIIDEDFWAIRYLVVDTKNWLPGKRVLVAPKWIERVSWPESKVFVNLSREKIQNAPEFSSESPLSRDYEVQLHTYYDRYGYWFEELAAV
jgi:hypothetical protein